eukprot:scaffold659_cov192-Ochromonas_danica.AAC.86
MTKEAGARAGFDLEDIMELCGIPMDSNFPPFPCLPVPFTGSVSLSAVRSYRVLCQWCTRFIIQIHSTLLSGS